MASEASTAGSPVLDVHGDMKLSPAMSASSLPQPGTPVPGGPNSRRPPRKSTLTQQQKNQKRQRATQEQLGTLEVEFNKNPTPTAVVRERIAQEINMTERSVQIWFQNRRAKIKNLAKKSIETGEDCDAIPESMRKYLAMQALESGKPLVRDMANSGLGSFNNGLIMNAESQAKVLISHLQCRTLSIGTWRRISQTALDLVVFYSPVKMMFTYYINADACGFKIEYPFSSIKNITLDNGDASAAAEGAAQRSGGLVVELSAPPSFSMDPGSGGFITCRDFTEDQQASKVLVHHLGGHSKILSGQLAKLVSLDSFRNRHALAEPQPPTGTMSAPVSPAIIRPASQPNHLLHPHAAFPQQDLSQAMGPPGPRVGHKRQRSRSVPAAVDMSQLRRPLPPFLQYDMPQSMHQPPQQAPQNNNLHQHIFAPIPQHVLQVNGQMQQQMGQKPQQTPPQQPSQLAQPPTTFAPVGSNLSINTTAAGYDFEFRSGPMSATTAASSEVEPGFFPPGPPSEAYSTPNLHTPYNATFYSPMVNPSNLSNPSFSPYIGVNGPDPVIANQSPPLPTFDRSASAGIFAGAEDNAGFPDDSFSFNDLYNKQQPFALPFRSPVMENAQPDFDFQNMVSFDGDASSVSPDASRVSATT